MADQTATFAIKLQDDTSGAALSAAQALEKLEASISADTKQLGAMQKALRNLQGATTPNVEQVKKLKERIDLQKQSIAKAQSSYIQLGGAFKSSGSSGKAFSDRLAAISKTAQGMPGPLGGLLGQLSKLSELVGGSRIALGIVAISAALVALVVATASAVKSLYEYGVAQADARRSELLRLEGLTKMRFLFQRVPGDAKQMQAAIDLVAARTPLAREKIATLGEELHRMGLRGTNFAKALEGAAIKTSVQGDAAGHAFAGWAAGAALTGRSVDKLVDNVKARLGGIAQKQMQSLTVQTLKQKEAMDSLFSGLDMDGYLSAWKSVGDLMTQATASGRALKLIVTTLLQPLIDTSKDSAPIVKRFFQGMIIAALQLLIVVLQVRNWFKRTFGDVTLFKGQSEMNVAVLAGEAALGLLITGLTLATVVAAGLAIKLTGLLVPALWKGTGALIKFGLQGIVAAVRGMIGFAAAAWGALLPLLPFIAAIVGVGLAIYMLIKYWDDLKLAFEQVDWLQAGKDMFTGIIEGLIPGGPLLVAKMKELGTSAIDAFQKALGIASPSKVFMRAGLAIPEGVAAGVDAGAPEAQRSTADMLGDANAATPKLGPASSPGGASEGSRGVGASRGSVSITIEAINVNAASGEPKQMAMDFRRELELTLEGLAAELGAPLLGGAS